LFQSDAEETDVEAGRSTANSHSPFEPEHKTRTKHRKKSNLKSSYSEYVFLHVPSNGRNLSAAQSTQCLMSESVERIEKGTQTDRTTENGVVLRMKQVPMRPSSCVVNGSLKVGVLASNRRSYPRGQQSSASSFSEVFLQFPENGTDTDSSSISSIE